MKTYVFLCFVVLFYGFVGVAQTQESNAEPELPESEKITIPSKETDNSAKKSALEFDMEAEPSIASGAYRRNIHLERKSLALEPIREADVAWSKRIWREIDTRQKINKVFVNEHQSFVEALLEILKKHPEIEVYTNESFTQVMPRADLWDKVYGRDTVQIWSFDLGDYVEKVTDNDLNLANYNVLRLKEDWVFDSKVSRMRARIIGIAPIREVLDPNSGQIRGQENLFWVHYESVRQYLEKYEAFNDYDDQHTLSWTDIFDMRRFASMITKENNNQGLNIRAYKVGREVNMEADRIHRKMRDFEFQLWSY